MQKHDHDDSVDFETQAPKTLRDEFALAALASGELFDARDLGPIHDAARFSTEAHRIALCAYSIADAMLEARKKAP